MDRGHRTLDHTADLALYLWAESEEALLVEGARAIVAELTQGARVEPNASRALGVTAVDREDRLVQWLNEVLVLALLEGFLVHDAEITLREDGLDAVLSGEAGAHAKIHTELKSATYHDLALAKDAAGRWTAQVVVDV
jgi:SHS2 domain-containing protein